MSPNTHCDTITKLKKHISTLAIQHGRDRHAVKLLAVSKTRTAAEIHTAIDCGLHAFGENYAQELSQKALSLGQMVADWHFIGPIQSNKTKIIAQHANWVHSIDRIKIARRLNDHWQHSDHIVTTKLNVCIQVNIDAETSKAGVSPAATLPLAEQITQLDSLQLRGLMFVPAIRSDVDEQRRIFAQCRALFDTLTDKGHPLDTLSMGMSGDYESAIAEGATIIRIGTAIFGPRNNNKESTGQYE